MGAAAVPGGVLPLEYHRKIGAGVCGVPVALQVLQGLGQGNGDGGAGVGASVPRVGGKQSGQFRVIGRKIQLHGAWRPVPFRNVDFLQHKLAGVIGTAVLVFQVVQAQQGTVGVLEHKGAVCPGGTGGDEVLRVVCIVFVGIVQVKPGARHRGADLVYLDQIALGDGNQVEFQFHVGIHVASLQIEEFQGVVGIIGKGVGSTVGPGLPCGQKFAAQGAIGLVVHQDIAGLEVDGQGGRIVDAAQVAHQHIVDEHPHVIVAGKIIGHRGAAGGTVHRAVGLLHKTGGHGGTEIVVDGRVAGVHVLDLAVDVEGEKLPQQRHGARRAHARSVVEDERIGGFVKLGKVQGAVVVIVAVLVDLQQVAHIGVGSLASVGQAGVEQVIQGLPALDQLGIPVLQGRLYHAGTGRAGAGVIVDAGPRPCRRSELQRFACVDALVHIGRVHIVGGVAGGDPVIKQVDGGADGRNPVGNNTRFGQRGRGRGRGFLCWRYGGFLRGGGLHKFGNCGLFRCGGLFGRGRRKGYGPDGQAGDGGDCRSRQKCGEPAEKRYRIHFDFLLDAVTVRIAASSV